MDGRGEGLCLVSVVCYWMEFFFLLEGGGW